MRFFRKRETLLENITLMAMIAALNAIVSLFGALFAVSAVFLVFFIPVSSAFLAYCCKAKYLPIYVVATLGVCIAVSAWDFSNTIFYTFPALIVGTMYGFLQSKRKDPVIILFIVSVSQFALLYLSMFPIEWIYGVSMETSLLTMLGQAGNPHAHSFFLFMLFAYAVGQMTVTEVFITIVLSNLAEENPTPRLSYLNPIIAIVLLGAGAGICFLYERVGFLLLGMGIFWAISCVLSYFPKPHWSSLAIFGLGAFVTVICFGLLWKSIPSPKGFILFGIPFLFLAISSFSNVALLRRQSVNKI